MDLTLKNLNFVNISAFQGSAIYNYLNKKK